MLGKLILKTIHLKGGEFWKTYIHLFLTQKFQGHAFVFKIHEHLIETLHKGKNILNKLIAEWIFHPTNKALVFFFRINNTSNED